MKRALELARSAQGSTSPNPPVGAVVVRDGVIVGEGYTRPPGGPHAERVALQTAGEAARGASLYVTLEPCSHWGRTPPCTDAIAAAGIAAVYVAAEDPNPLVRGGGVRLLREHGIRVIEEQDEMALELIEPHAMHSVQGRPFVTIAIDLPDSFLDRLLDVSDKGWWDHTQDARVSSARRGRRLHLHPAAVSEREEQTPRTWKEALSESGATSFLVAIGAPADRSPVFAALYGEKLVDKVIAERDEIVPHGFTIVRRPGDPLPHVVAYPED